MNIKISNIKNILITGISGSGGSYLAEYIIKNFKKINVHGISRWHSTSSDKNIKDFRNKVVLHECDMLDFGSMIRTLRKSKPDIIFHLASNANVRSSFDNPIAILNNNVSITSNLLEGIRVLKIDPIIQICSTSEVYGQVFKNEIPIKETNPYRPVSPYAVSKTTQDLLSYAYFKSFNQKIIRTRMFAYLNPKRDDLFASSFAKQVALIEKGKLKKLKHGNLNSTRTLIDVEDAMRAYWLAAIHCNYGEDYNIGGNKIIKVGEFLKKLIRLSKTKIITEVDKKLLRPADVTLQIPDTKKFFKATKFKPKVSFNQSMRNLLEFWRVRTDKE